jgi:uncharacterized protein YndB with AHSA1/START domain
MERAIRKQIVVAAPVTQVWNAWTTREGATSFFAPRANLELAIGGPYEMLFDLEAPPGSQGSEGCKILSYLPPEMLSFDWNAPPQQPNVRRERTWVVVQLEPQGAGATRVKVTHLGWGEGEEWEQVFDYFVRAWRVVLGRLERRFAFGPVDWRDPYRPPPE